MTAVSAPSEGLILKLNYLYKDEIYNLNYGKMVGEPNDTRIILVTYVNEH